MQPLSTSGCPTPSCKGTHSSPNTPQSGASTLFLPSPAKLLQCCGRRAFLETCPTPQHPARAQHLPQHPSAPHPALGCPCMLPGAGCCRLPLPALQFVPRKPRLPGGAQRAGRLPWGRGPLRQLGRPGWFPCLQGKEFPSGARGRWDGFGAAQAHRGVLAVPKGRRCCRWPAPPRPRRGSCRGSERVSGGLRGENKGKTKRCSCSETCA